MGNLMNKITAEVSTLNPANTREALLFSIGYFEYVSKLDSDKVYSSSDILELLNYIEQHK